MKWRTSGEQEGEEMEQYAQCISWRLLGYACISLVILSLCLT